MSEVGEKVQAFYNRTPFPDFELSRFKQRIDLRIAIYPFGNTLNEEIPDVCSIIDVGCGTGQFINFLSLNKKRNEYREVYGIDFSDSSLNKARAFKKRMRNKNLTLKKVNILNKEEIDAINKKFDFILCLGVLHHTGQPYKGFQNILRLAKPESYIAIGLYNKYGRLGLNIRQFLAKTIFKNNNVVKDYFIKMQIGNVEDKERARGWWNDQYLHPHESVHTIGEVLKWFDENGIEYCGTAPKTYFVHPDFVRFNGLWGGGFHSDKRDRPGKLERILTQLQWIFSTDREGGYWITFGRKLK